MKKKLAILFLALIVFQTPISLAEEKTFFSDVPNGEENFVAIQYLYDQSIVSGYPDGSFQPDKSVTRAEALKIIMLAFDVPLEEVKAEPVAKPTTEETTFTNLETGKVEIVETVKVVAEPKVESPSEFSDIDENAWYIDFIQSGIDHKLINGYEDGTFRPHDNINLAEALKISLSANKTNVDAFTAPDEIFTDVKKEDWFSAFVFYAKEHQLLDISLDNTINPAQQMTRGKLCELIYRILKSKEGYSFGVATYYGDGANGARTASGVALNNATFQAAHKTLPFNTVVRVTNPTNGKFVDVVVVDRGPYAYGRVLDLTKSAFAELTDPSAGVLRVHYQVLKPE